MARPWWKDGVQFECRMSGKCCVSRGEYGHVYLTREDRQRLAAHFRVSTRAFTRQFCTRTPGGYAELVNPPDTPACIFFVAARCSVYEARPTQCRTWPFWPELMAPKAWAAEVAAFCPGVGHGRVVPAAEIRAAIVAQRRAEAEDD